MKKVLKRPHTSLSSKVSKKYGEGYTIFDTNELLINARV